MDIFYEDSPNGGKGRSLKDWSSYVDEDSVSVSLCLPSILTSSRESKWNDTNVYGSKVRINTEYELLIPKEEKSTILCSGMDENVVGTCAELISAPIDASFADVLPFYLLDCHEHSILGPLLLEIGVIPQAQYYTVPPLNLPN